MELSPSIEFVSAKCVSEKELNAPIYYPVITPMGVLCCGICEPEFAIELRSPDHTLLHSIPLRDEPRCLLCKGQWMFCALYNGNILVLSAEDGSILHTIKKAHSYMDTNSLALWGTYLISCGFTDGMVRWWHLGSWEAVQEQGSRVGYAYSLAVSTSGVLAVGGHKNIALLDAQTGQPKEGLLMGHSRAVYCLVWQNEHRLVSGSADNDILLWDVDSRACLATLKGHKGPVYDLALRGPILASASGDKTVRLRSLETHQCLQVLEGHRSYVYCITFSGPHLICASDDNRLMTWKGGHYRMSKESIRTLLLCHKYGNCRSFSCIPMDILKMIVRMVDEALMWGM